MHTLRPIHPAPVPAAAADRRGGGEMTTRLDVIRARLAAATPGRMNTATVDPEIDPVEWFRSNLEYGSGLVHAVIALDHPQHVGPDDRPEHAVTVAVTGNGPNSERNAQFYAAAPADLAALLDVVEAVQKETRAWGSCPLCHRWMNHTDDCPMKPLLEVAT